MNASHLNTTENTQENEEIAAEKLFNRKACRAFIFLLYSLDALVIGANIQIWGHLFGII